MTPFQQLQTHFQMGYGQHNERPALRAEYALSQQHGSTVGHFAGLELHSYYQPLLHAASMRVFAHEALLRPRAPGDTHFQAPHTAFDSASTPQAAVYLDRLCRVIHALNFVRQAPGNQYLFLNVSAQHLQSVAHSHGEAFESLLSLCGLQPAQVVLEILEASVDNLALLQMAVASWRERGFQIAIDDFGCQHSNFDRLWQLTPNIVKLDRQLVHQAEQNTRAAIILPKLIDMIHDLGASVVCEGVETALQHRICVEAGADLLQGYLYARPAAQLHASSHAATTLQ